MKLVAGAKGKGAKGRAQDEEGSETEESEGELDSEGELIEGEELSATEEEADVEEGPEGEEGEAPEGGRNRAEVKALINRGREKGFLTLDEVNDALPTDIVSSEQIEDVMSMFGENDIELVDDATKVKLPETKPPEPDSPGQPAEKDEEERDEDYDAGYSKGNDPVRMYLRKMGSVSLLTREGEVEIAKRIEEGGRAAR